MNAQEQDIQVPEWKNYIHPFCPDTEVNLWLFLTDYQTIKR